MRLLYQEFRKVTVGVQARTEVMFMHLNVGICTTAVEMTEMNERRGSGVERGAETQLTMIFTL